MGNNKRKSALKIQAAWNPFWPGWIFSFNIHQIEIAESEKNHLACKVQRFLQYSMYTLFQKKRKIADVAFLLEKSVYRSDSGVIHHFDNALGKTLCQGQWPRGTRGNGQIKVTFLLEKSVHSVYMGNAGLQVTLNPIAFPHHVTPDTWRVSRENRC